MKDQITEEFIASDIPVFDIDNSGNLFLLWVLLWMLVQISMSSHFLYYILYTRYLYVFVLYHCIMTLYYQILYGIKGEVTLISLPIYISIFTNFGYYFTHMVISEKVIISNGRNI